MVFTAPVAIIDRPCRPTLIALASIVTCSSATCGAMPFSMPDNCSEAFIGSSTNGLRQVDHDGHFLVDATALLPSKSIGALAKDPADDSIWIGYRDGHGLTRLKPDGTVLVYGSAALGSRANSAVWDIQVQPATATSKRRILVAFRSGAVGIYDGE